MSIVLANAAPPPEILIEWVVLPTLALLAAAILAGLWLRRHKRKH